MEPTNLFFQRTEPRRDHSAAITRTNHDHRRLCIACQPGKTSIGECFGLNHELVLRLRIATDGIGDESPFARTIHRLLHEHDAAASDDDDG